jgi:Glutamyl-tRNAGlu reductase, dimerisation domain
MRPGRDSVERIRRHELSRALKKVNASSEEAGIIDLLSRSLVGKLLDGPISEAMARAEAEISSGDPPSPEASPRPKTDHRMGENGKPSIEFEIGGNQISRNYV